MIAQVLMWYITIFILGVIGLPITYALFDRLYDRGILFSRMAVLFLWGFIHWLFVSLGVFTNNLAGTVLSLGLVFVISGYFFWKSSPANVFEFIRKNWRSILRGEIIFLVFFTLMAIFRASVPDIIGTEKPMELAFINGILRSDSFPPQDPWLSGYGISYYYFGYVIIALLIQLTGIPNGIAYNLTAAVWFALTALAAYALIFNLLSFYKERLAKKLNAAAWAFIAPIFVLIVSNIEGFLEVLYAGGIFWKAQPDGSYTSWFWSWLNLKELNQAPALPFDFMINRPGLLWWRGSRVVSDVNLLDMPTEVIDEFPFFSYLLGDLHPHVLAVPFVIMILALTFHFFIVTRDSDELYVHQWWRKPEMWFAVILFGGLSFLNTWNFPIYVGLFSAVFAYHYYLQYGWNRQVFLNFVINGLEVGLAGVLLYLPFYLSFSSQAGGILPSLSYFTKGGNFWVMYMPLLLPILIWLFTINTDKNKVGWLDGVKFALLLILGLSTVSFLLAFIIIVLPGFFPNTSAGLIDQLRMAAGDLLGKHGAVNINALFGDSFIRRLKSPGTLVTLFIMVVFVWSKFHKTASDAEGSTKPNETVFVALMIFLGAGLTLFPEFMYLRDHFGTRMNTIFKFYYEAWILWSLAAAYATVVIFNQKIKAGIVFRVLIAITFVLSLFYPVIMLDKRSGNLNKPENWTLDGNEFRNVSQPYEYEAAEWLRLADDGVIVEAVGEYGGSYSGYASMSMLSGQQTILGWIGHEQQWRGGNEEIGSRNEDIRRLYETTQWTEAIEVIQMYGIRYIIVSYYENSVYRVQESKFERNLPVVFENPGVIIYDAGAY